MRILGSFLLALLLTTAALGGEMGRDLYLPVAGRATSADGREYHTQLWLMNPTEHRVDVAVTYMRIGSKDPAQSISIRLPARASVTRDLDEQLLGTGNSVGALRIRAKHDVAATARIYSRMKDESLPQTVGATMDAVSPARAVSAGQRTLLGALPGTPYKLYAVETSGAPLQLAVRMIGADGKLLASRRVYLEAHTSQRWELTAGLPAAREAAWVEIEGVNGSGKCIVTGEALFEQSRDSVFFTMARVTEPRFRLGVPEVVVMTAIALALIVAAIARRR